MTKTEFIHDFAEWLGITTMTAERRCAPILKFLEERKLCQFPSSRDAVAPYGASDVAQQTSLLTKLVAENISNIGLSEFVDRLSLLSRRPSNDVKICAHCGRAFIARRKTQKYCSDGCRYKFLLRAQKEQRAVYKKKAAESTAKTVTITV